MLQVTPTIVIPETEFVWQFARSGGPGGQNVNKVESKAILRWAIAESPSVPPMVKVRLQQAHPSYFTNDGELLLTSQRFRDQPRNKADCLHKLTELLRQAATPPKLRRPTKPSKGSKQRRLTAKKQRSERKATRRTPNSD